MIPGDLIDPSTSIDTLFGTLFPTKSSDLTPTPPVYRWLDVGVLAGVWPDGTMEIARFEARPVAPSSLTLAAPDASAADSYAPLQDGLYYKEDFTDIDCVGTDAHSRYLAPDFSTTGGVHGVSFAPWTAGHAGILQLKSGNGAGQNSLLQRNYGFGNASALDLSKVTRLIYRSVIMVDSMFLTYGGGGEQTWGVLSQANPICGAMFSIAPGFVDTVGATAGQNLVTGTYQDASVPTMQDISRPAAPIVAGTWYDTMISWTSTAVKFYYRVWTAAGTNPWILVGTNTLFIGTGMPVYPTHNSKSYGDTAGRSMFLDLEEMYIDVSTPKRFIGSDLLSY